MSCGVLMATSRTALSSPKVAYAQDLTGGQRVRGGRGCEGHWVGRMGTRCEGVNGGGGGHGRGGGKEMGWEKVRVGERRG